MALDDVGICNLGLANIGQSEFIEAIGEDSVAGAVAKLFYAQEREAVLRDFFWPFAKRVLYPAALSAAALANAVVPDEWGFAYAYPPECLFLRGVYSGVRNPREDQKVEHELYNDAKLGRVVLTDQGSAVLLITANVTDPNQFSPDFADTLGWRMGFRFALSVRKDKELAKEAYAVYRASLATSSANATREAHVRRPDAPHIAARR